MKQRRLKPGDHVRLREYEEMTDNLEKSLYDRWIERYGKEFKVLRVSVKDSCPELTSLVVFVNKLSLTHIFYEDRLKLSCRNY